MAHSYLVTSKWKCWWIYRSVQWSRTNLLLKHTLQLIEN